MSDPKDLLIAYATEGDLLAIGIGAWANGGGHSVTSNSFFTGFYAEPETNQCVGFEILDAALILTPYLNGKLFKGTAFNNELAISYRQETDTLILVSNREPFAQNQPVADGLVAHCNKHGLAVGFTMKNAAKLLRPHLKEWKTKTAAVS